MQRTYGIGNGSLRIKLSMFRICISIKCWLLSGHIFSVFYIIKIIYSTIIRTFAMFTSNNLPRVGS